MIRIDLNDGLEDLLHILDAEASITEVKAEIFQELGKGILKEFKEERITIQEAVELSAKLIAAMAERGNAIASLLHACAEREQGLFGRL